MPVDHALLTDATHICVPTGVQPFTDVAGTRREEVQWECTKCGKKGAFDQVAGSPVPERSGKPA